MTDITRLRSLAESLNSPQSKRRDTMAGVLYEARREVVEILAEMEVQSAPVVWQVRLLHDKGHALENEWCDWRDISKYWFGIYSARIDAGTQTRMQVRARAPLPEPPALADRCERSVGPDRELDAEIAKAVGLSQLLIDRMIERGLGPATYTGSIDAAMTLVPDKCWLTLDRYSISDVEAHQQRNWRVWIKTLVGDLDGDGPCALVKQLATGTTPALALCAAALRARAAEVRG